MTHIHSVYDSDTHFSVNAVTRALKNESSSKTTLVQGDHGCERFTFQIPRMIEGHDMSLCNEVEVHYINIDAKTKEEIRGLYEVDDMQISPNGDDFVICSWLIDRHATQLVGQLSFLLRFKCVTDGIIDYAWHTAPYTGIYVSSGINADETFEEDYCDVIERWKESVLNDLTAEMRVIADEMKDEVAAWEEAATIQVRSEMTSFGAQWNNTLDVERVRIDELAAMRGTGDVTEYNFGDSTGEVYGTITSNGTSAHFELRFNNMLFTSVRPSVSPEVDIPDELMPTGCVVIEPQSPGKEDFFVRVDPVAQGRVRIQIRHLGDSETVLTSTDPFCGHYSLASVSIPEVTDARVGVDNQGKPKTYDSAGDAVRAAQQMAADAFDLATNNEADVFRLTQEVDDLKKNGTGGGSVARISYVDLLASGWQGEQSPYSQVVAVDGATANSQVDLTPSVEQLTVFYNKDLAFVTENEDGVVTVYAIGQKPTNDYTIQVTITEVVR